MSMTRDDVIRSTAAHIRRVGELMVNVAAQLSIRAIVHDAGKWSPDEWPAFEAATPQLAGLTYGSDEYKAALRSIGPAVKHHQTTNTHHPEFFGEHVCVQCGADDRDTPCTCGGPRSADLSGMDLLDLMEMLCDWKAAGERHDNGSMAKSLEHNRGRFKIEPQLLRVLTNTAQRQGWLATLDALTSNAAEERKG